MNNEQPDELQKAIEEVNEFIEHKAIEACSFELWNSLSKVNAAAKQLRQVEKERDELKLENTVLGPAATNYALVAQQRDQLKAALEECVNKLIELKWHDLRDSHKPDNCFVCERIVEALSNPIVQSIINKQNENTKTSS